MKCPRCYRNCEVYKQINRSGSVVVVERCPVCRVAPDPKNSFLPKGQHNVDKLPVFEDYSQDAPRCVVEGCQNVGSEWHHFAPKHLFEDAEKWPKEYLCQSHHKEWHEKTNTGSYITRIIKKVTA